MSIFTDKITASPGATAFTQGGHQIFLHIDELKAEQQPLLTLFPYSKGLIYITGPDAASFLQGVTTNNIYHLSNDSGFRSLVTTSKGRVAFDLVIQLAGDGIYKLYTEPGEEQQVIDFLEFYHILEEMECKIAPPSYLFLAFSEENLVGDAIYTSPDGHASFLQLDQLEKRKVEFAEAQWIGMEDFERLRPLFRWVRAGVDFDNSNLPLEVGLNHLVDYLKGCYIGQEPIARMFHKGRATKVLCQFKTRQAIPTRERIYLDNQSVGHITSFSSFDRGGLFMSLGFIATRIWENPLDLTRLNIGSEVVVKIDPLESVALKNNRG